MALFWVIVALCYPGALCGMFYYGVQTGRQVAAGEVKEERRKSRQPGGQRKEEERARRQRITHRNVEQYGTNVPQQEVM